MADIQKKLIDVAGLGAAWGKMKEAIANAYVSKADWNTYNATLTAKDAALEAKDAEIISAYEAADATLTSNLAALTSSYNTAWTVLTKADEDIITAYKKADDDLSKRIKANEDLLAGDWNNKTVLETINGVNGDLDARVTDLEDTLAEGGTFHSYVTSEIDAAKADAKTAYDKAVDVYDTIMGSDEYAGAIDTIKEIAAWFEEEGAVNGYTSYAAIVKGQADNKAAIATLNDTTIPALEQAYKDADDALDAKITAARTAYVDADNVLKAYVTAEDNKIVAAYEAADNALDAKIDALTQSYNNAWTALTQADADIIGAYEAADSALDTKIGALQTAYNNLKAELQAKDTEIIGAYEAADEALGGRIDALQTAYNNLKSELQAKDTEIVSSYQAADNALDAKIGALNTAYVEADTALKEFFIGNLGDDKIQSTSVLGKIVTAYEAADEALATAIGAANDRIDAVEEAYVSADSTLKSELISGYTTADNGLSARIDVFEANTYFYSADVATAAEVEGAISW